MLDREHIDCLIDKHPTLQKNERHYRQCSKALVTHISNN